MNSIILSHSHCAGHSHIAKGLSCEDYSLTYEDERIAVATVADGHGDPNCFRSERGARMACDAAVSVIRSLTSDDPDFLDLLMQADESALQNTERMFVKKWMESVSLDIEENPFAEAELEALTDERTAAMFRQGLRLEKAYGSTMIAAMFAEGFWTAWQIGDGRCVAIQPDGLYEQPIPWDDVRCVGNRSSSLCDADAADAFRHFSSQRVPTAVFVASDGMDESFDEAGLNKCFYSIAYWMQAMTREEVDKKLEELLPQISAGGSGDDISVAGIAQASPPVAKPAESSKSVAARRKLLFEDIRLQVDELTSECSALHDRIEELQAELAEKEALLNKRSAELTGISTDMPGCKESKERGPLSVGARKV